MATAPQNITLGELAQAAIAKYLQHTVAYKKPVLTDADPENLHQMRVGLRRLRTAVQVFDAGLDLPKAGREPTIAALGRKLGQLRDLDVIAMGLRDRYAPDLPETEQPYLDVVLLQLAKQRGKTFKQVKRLLKGDRYQKFKQALTTWVDKPTYKAIAALPAEQALPDLVLPLVSQLWLHPGWLFGTKAMDNKAKSPKSGSPKSGSPKAAPSGIQVQTRLSQAAVDTLISEQGAVLHSLRKQVKRVRYQLRLVADLYPGALEGDIQRLSDLQDTLGDLQDSTVLEDFIAVVVPDAKAQMPQLFALLADRRHCAWKQWQSHQKHYLDAAQRQRLRLVLLHPGQPLGEALEVKQSLTKDRDKETIGNKHGSVAPQSRRRSTAREKSSSSKTTPRHAKPAPEDNSKAG
ncbi:MAG: CHAD domain-containing protein [Nodosilinea sp.]